jgi:hypothetical protein
VGLVAGAGFGLLAGVALACAPWGAALAVLLTATERRAARSGSRDGGLALVGAILLAVAASAAAAKLGGAALLVALPAAALATAL